MDDELRRIREKKMKDMMESLVPSKKETSPSQKPRVLYVDERNFQQMLSEHPAMVIDFWAEWCGPCRMVSPIVERLAAEFAGTITFGKCNTDQNPRIAIQFSISAIPTLLFFSHGSLVHRVIGAYPEEALRSQILRTFGSRT